MNFKCQVDSIDQLTSLAAADRHSILIDGPKGCGKTYLSKLYASKVGAYDYVSVDPNVQAIKDTLDSCFNLDQKIVVCIENLDSGMLSASYTLLKFLEEPRSNVYIVVTCRNIRKVPDTIISRSACVSVSPPILSDIDDYSRVKDDIKYTRLSKKDIWRCVRTFGDVDLVYSMSPEQLDYYSYLDPKTIFKDSIANITWMLGHYKDNSETPLEFVIRYILCSTQDMYVRKICAQCVSDLLSARIAKHAVLAKFAFEGKYGE